jgi:hypothetical protein
MICDPIFFVRGQKTGEIYGRMTIQYGENCTIQREIYEWVVRFKGGRADGYEDGRSERPSSVNVLTLRSRYEGVPKSFRTGHLERELQMVQLSATRCSCIAIL